MKNKRCLLLALTLSVLAGTSGCANVTPAIPENARISNTTAVHDDLVNLPEPKGKIAVAVYNFTDQTGQYKGGQTTSNFSTAVTQGSTSVLIQALKNTGWFIPVEREGLSNLLTERKIARAKLQNNSDSVKVDLPSLRDAPMLLEGGIIGYDTNVVTSGYGLKYFGAGADASVRKDRVTVYLRAVNVMTGEVIKSVSTSKTILSQQVGIGLFRYVRVKRLLEIEAGFSTNEPLLLCVQEAIEKAVLSLIIEGVLDNNWALADNNQISSPVISRYLEENGRTLQNTLDTGKERKAPATQEVYSLRNKSHPTAENTTPQARKITPTAAGRAISPLPNPYETSKNTRHRGWP